MLLFPVGITFMILAIASLSSIRDAFWFSLILHLFLFVFFLGSYIVFLLRERKKNRL
jgi:ATP/ADP translocase